MRPIKTAGSATRDRILAQTDLSQVIDRNSSGPQTVSRDLLLAPIKTVRAIQRAHKDVAGGHRESAQKEIAGALDIAPQKLLGLHPGDERSARRHEDKVRYE